MNALYNEIDPFAANWLEQLARENHIAAGRVERRSIADLKPSDVAGGGQRHFFAGIGGWSYSLRLANVPDDADIWTGSCPCQPFSAAGKGLGILDARHLWPAWFALIRECRPPVIFGEQVASPDGLTWLDFVFHDLEGCGYSVGATNLSAAGVGAPHIRQRIYFVAYADGERLERLRLRLLAGRSRSSGLEARRGSEARTLADREEQRRGSGWDGGSDRGSTIESDRYGTTGIVADSVLAGRSEGRTSAGRGSIAGGCSAGGLGNAGSDRTREHAGELHRHEAEHEERAAYGDQASVDPSATRDGTCGLAHADIAHALDGDEPGSGRELQPARDASASFWSKCDWVPCLDGKARPVEPGTFPLAHGVPARVGRLRGYGNAIVSEQAATFIEAALQAGGLR